MIIFPLLQSVFRFVFSIFSKFPIMLSISLAVAPAAISVTGADIFDLVKKAGEFLRRLCGFLAIKKAMVFTCHGLKF